MTPPVESPTPGDRQPPTSQTDPALVATSHATQGDQRGRAPLLVFVRYRLTRRVNRSANTDPPSHRLTL